MGPFQTRLPRRPSPLGGKGEEGKGKGGEEKVLSLPPPLFSVWENKREFFAAAVRPTGGREAPYFRTVSECVSGKGEK